MDTPEQTFGNLIRRRRIALGVGQEPFADRVGIHRTHISLIERGKRLPTILVLKKLAVALDTTMTDLIAEFEAVSAAPKEPEPAKRVRRTKS